jgi:hypothetical protein
MGYAGKIFHCQFVLRQVMTYQIDLIKVNRPDNSNQLIPDNIFAYAILFRQRAGYEKAF